MAIIVEKRFPVSPETDGDILRIQRSTDLVLLQAEAMPVLSSLIKKQGLKRYSHTSSPTW